MVKVVHEEEIPKGLEPESEPPAEPEPAPVIHLDDVGAMIADLRRRYEAGEIRGLAIVVACADHTFDVATVGLNYIERLGLLAAAMDTVNAAARAGEQE